MSTFLIHIGIVDDHNLVRNALKNCLLQTNFFNVKIDAANVRELADQLTKDSKVDVIILDLYMPELAAGKECFMLLREKFPHINVLVLSMCQDYYIVNELLSLGACGYLSKSVDIPELTQAIREISKNGIYHSKITTEALYLHAQRIANKKTLPPEDLSERQKQVIRLLWQEKSTQEIANEIFVSVSAVDKIKQQLKEKTGIKSTVGLLKYAIENNIIMLPLPLLT